MIDSGMVLIGSRVCVCRSVHEGWKVEDGVQNGQQVSFSLSTLAFVSFRCDELDLVQIVRVVIRYADFC